MLEFEVRFSDNSAIEFEARGWLTAHKHVAAKQEEWAQSAGYASHSAALQECDGWPVVSTFNVKVPPGRDAV